MNEERLVAQQDVVVLDRRTLSVRISEHAAESFWRVEVSQVGTGGPAVTATAAADDGFLMDLIHAAVDGEQQAWRHLAQWGHANLTRPAGGFRAAFA